MAQLKILFVPGKAAVQNDAAREATVQDDAAREEMVHEPEVMTAGVDEALTRDTSGSVAVAGVGEALMREKGGSVAVAGHLSLQMEMQMAR